MARRAGKAASRKARQRNVPRAPRPAAPPTAPDQPVEAATTTPTLGDPPRPARRPSAPAAYAGGSTLTAAERSEYHYVERDLRNIGILTLVMFGLLVGAWLLFTATGLIG